MRKKYVFTEDCSFKSIKDKMHMSVTEHVVQEEQSKKLYHYVVSYGSWFSVDDESVFMSHLLEKIGVTGFSKAYSADGCKISLPWYPSSGLTCKGLVELPEGVKVEDFEFGRCKSSSLSDKFKKTFLAKTFKVTTDKGQTEYTAEYVFRELFAMTTCECGIISQEDETKYPLYCCLLSDFQFHTKKDMKKLLQKTDVCKISAIRSVLKKFAKLDIKKEIKEFEQETQKDMSALCKELLERQFVIKTYLLLKREDTKLEELEI